MDKWTKHFSNTYGQHYWYNNNTKESSWIEPSEAKILQNEIPDDKNGDMKRLNEASDIHSEAKEDSQIMEGRIIKKRKCDDMQSDVTRTYKPFVGIIVPFRDLHVEQNREAHLAKFVPHMESFLSKSGIPFRIYIVEQSNDGRKFNRGKLLNIGFVIAKSDGCEVFVFHDVDLLPSPELLQYYVTKPERNPVHIARVWNRYNTNPKYFGGVNSFSREMFENMNGFPNNFWGWGGEDDELYKRSVETRLKAEAPKHGSFEDLENMSIGDKMAVLREHSLWKCMNRKEVLEEHSESWRQNGLFDLNYLLLSRRDIGGHAIRFCVDVKVNNHWTDLACAVDDSQLEESVDSLKSRFSATREEKPASKANT